MGSEHLVVVIETSNVNVKYYEIVSC